MKKRYLAMLMAMLMCLTLFSVGAMAEEAAEETPVEAAEPATESAAPSEAPVETAQPSETPTEDVPQPVALEGEAEEIPTLTKELDVDYEGDVEFGDLKPSSAPCPASSNGISDQFEWTGDNVDKIQNKVTLSAGQTSDYYTNFKMTVQKGIPSGTYNFVIYWPSPTESVTRSVTRSVMYRGALIVKAANPDSDPEIPDPEDGTVTLSFPISQKISVKNEGAQPGEKTFSYKLIFEHWDANAQLSIKDSTGGAWSLTKGTTQSGTMTAPQSITTYDLTLTMTSGLEATANISVTTTKVAVAHVFQVTPDDGDWTNARKMYDAIVWDENTGWAGGQVDTDDNGSYLYMLDNPSATEEQIPSVTGDPEVGYKGDVYYGPDGKWYYTGSVNTALKAAFTSEYTAVPPTYEHNGFTVNAWTFTHTGWDAEKMEYIYSASDVKDLEGAVFGVYADEDCHDCLATFTTDADGNAPVTAASFATTALPEVDGAEKTYYLKQLSAPADAEHGERPVPEMVWPFTGKSVTASEGNGIVVTLEAPTPYGAGGYNEDLNEFQVYNDHYTSMQFKLEKTVSVKNEDVELGGSKRFDFQVAFYSAGKFEGVKLYFTPKGGTKTEITHFIEGEDIRQYDLSLTVDGAGTAEGVVTIEGWECALYGFVDVYEMTAAEDNWEHASYMYMMQLPTVEEGAVLYDGVELTAWIASRTDAPEGGGAVKPGELVNDDIYRGYDERFYVNEFDEVGIASFASVYTAAKTASTATAAPAATQAATAKQSPKTGDEANVALWLVLATVSATGIAMVAGKKKVK